MVSCRTRRLAGVVELCRLPLAPPLAFWRDLACRFAEKLVHLPGLEALRNQATAVLEEDEVEHWLAIAPRAPARCCRLYWRVVTFSITWAGRRKPPTPFFRKYRSTSNPALCVASRTGGAPKPLTPTCASTSTRRRQRLSAWTPCWTARRASGSMGCPSPPKKPGD
jgi:hypothetical protein